MHSTVCFNGATLDALPIRSGVKQGCVLHISVILAQRKPKCLVIFKWRKSTFYKSQISRRSEAEAKLIDVSVGRVQYNKDDDTRQKSLNLLSNF